MNLRPPARQSRREPRQARARETVGRILDATAYLLDQAGLEAVTTNAIAAQADVNVATLYGYFPNKYAVLRALGERFDAKRTALIGSALNVATHWSEALEVGLDGFVALLVAEPGAASLLEASKTCPELRDEGSGVHQRIADTLAGYLRSQTSDIGPARARTMANVLVESSAGVVGLARRASPRERRRILDEHKRMIRAYLESAGL